MKKILKYLSILLLGSCSASCAPVQLHPDNEPVRLIFYNEVNLVNDLPHCTYIGPVISSYGRWFNYLFISNTKLTQGAIEEMYNRANEIGANVVYINNHIDFTTSVTLLGQAYRCSE